MPSELPGTFVLYNSSRKSVYDQFTGFTYVQATNTENIWSLTPIGIAGAHSIDRVPTGKEGQCAYYGHIKMMGPTGNLEIKSALDWTTWFNIQSGPGMPSLPVLEIRDKPHKLFADRLKRNIHLLLSNAVLTPVEPVATSLNTTYAIKRGHVATSGGLPTINLFVARQLLDLAKSRKEMCPITAEDLTDEHCAAMPCGHLFMRDAIEESFKIKKNECPLCRLAGAPTYM